MVHYMMEGILITVIIALSIYIWLYRRQVRELHKQLQFHKEEESNRQISIDIRAKECLELQQDLNDLLKEKRIRQNKFNMEEKKLMDMVTNVSHDIRTPLTSISGYFQMYSQSTSEEDKSRYQAIIEGRLKALAEMLEEFFTYFKIRNGQYNQELKVCDVQRVLCETMFLFIDDMKDAGIEPEIDIPEDSVEMIINEENIRRIFFNIIKNALVHGKEKIVIQMKESKESIEFVFRNKSRETIPENVEEVFERFYSGDKSRNTQSSGLGLSIAKEMVEDIGGAIWAFSEGEYFGIGIKLKR